jgi:hypothetical protein
MSKFAAAITIPVTNANMQENSTRSITSLVICTLPDCAVPRAIPLCRPPLKLGRTVTVAVQILAMVAAFVGAWVGFSLQFKSEDILILQANCRACAPRETAARLERELAGVGVASTRGVGRSFANVFASLNPSRAALSPDRAGHFIGRRDVISRRRTPQRGTC